MIDLLQVCDAKAEFPSRCDVSGLAEEQVFRGVVIVVLAFGSNTFRVVQPQGRRSAFATRFFNGLQFDGIHSDWVGRHQESAGWIDEILNLRERPAMPYLTHAVHDMQHGFRP